VKWTIEVLQLCAKEKKNEVIKNECNVMIRMTYKGQWEEGD